MFTCAIGQHTSKAGERMTKLVTEQRDRIYKDQVGNVVGIGKETVTEIALCPEHASQLTTLLTK